MLLLLPALFSTESLQHTDPDLTHLFVIPMSAVLLPLMLIVTSQAVHAADPAVLVPAEEMADDQVHAENEEKELEADVVAVVLQIVLLVMEDLAKLRKNSMPRWRITGDRRKMALARKLLLQRLLLLMETTST